MPGHATAGTSSTTVAADPKTRFDIWYAPAESGRINDQAAVKILATEAVESQGQISPDHAPELAAFCGRSSLQTG